MKTVTRREFLRMAWGGAAAVGVGALSGVVGCQLFGPAPQATAPPAAGSSGQPSSELTFIVAGDSHFGAKGMAEANEKMVRAINALPGTPWPEQIGGAVGRPRGVLFMGDMTDNGAAWEWNAFEKLYGRTGREGLLKFPIFEASGNHDRLLPFSPVMSHVKVRHGGLTYSWDWDGVHFVCLDLYPDARNLAWLRADMEKVGPLRPVVAYWHYTPEADFAIIGQDWTAAEKRACQEALRPYNVAAIFCGHWHMSGQFNWGGYDLFQPGAPRHSCRTFMAARIKDGQLAVAVWDWDRARWEDAYVKKLRVGAGQA